MLRSLRLKEHFRAALKTVDQGGLGQCVGLLFQERRIGVVANIEGEPCGQATEKGAGEGGGILKFCPAAIPSHDKDVGQ